MERILQVKKVTFVINTDGNGMPDKQAVLYRGETVKPPVLPTRAKLTFEGWYADAGFKQPWDFSVIPAGSVSLFAKWVPKDGGGEGGPDPIGEPGSEDNPFQIGDSDDAADILQNIGGDDGQYPLDAYYELTGNIELDTTKSNNWEPIGDVDKPFTGSFNGNGFYIKGMRIQVTNENDDRSMFGSAGIKSGTGQPAEVKNFGLIDARITNNGGNNNGLTGTVVAVNAGRLENVYIVGSNSSVLGSNIVGGMVGRNEARGTIRNCFVSIAGIMSGAGGGGIAGGIAGDNSGTIENCFVLTKTIDVGTGIQGFIAGQSTGTLKGNYAYGSLSSNAASNNGASLALDTQAKQQSFWENAGFVLSDNGGMWWWHGSTGMPTLGQDQTQGDKELQPWPTW